MRNEGGWRVGAVGWLLFAVASSVWCATATGRLGATFDEPLYLAEGLKCWRTGSHAPLLRWGTMPLPADVQTLPLYLAERVTGSPWNLDTDFATALRVMRLGTLPFWWMLLVYARLIGRSLAGPRGGLVAVALCACEPNLLAHASLATTDIAVTACLLAFVYHWRAGRDGSWLVRIGLPGLLYGVALLAKASSLAFVPVLMLALEAERLWRERPESWWSAICRFTSDAVQTGALGLAVLFVLCGSDWQPEAGFVAWAEKLPSGPFRDRMAWLADSLRLFPNAGEGLVRQIKHNMRGHGMFLLGESHPKAVWYYFPLLLTVKLPCVLLLAGLVVLLARPRAMLNAATLAALALLLFSFNCRVQIGLRLILPCVVLGIIGLATALAARRPAGGLALAGWLAVVSLGAWPDGLRYANEFWGGTTRGYKVVGDSNYDWGQGLPELADWASQHSPDGLDVWYFGRDPAVNRTPLRELPLHLIPSPGPADVRGLARGRYLAAGTSVVFGCGLTAEHRAAQCWLRPRKPVARVGTFLIYDLHPEGRP